MRRQAGTRMMRLHKWSVGLGAAATLTLGGDLGAGPHGGVALRAAHAGKVAGPHEKLALLVEQYLERLFAAKPHLATFMGDHRFDAKLPDVSPEALARRHGELEKQQKELAAIDRKALAADDQVDADIMSDGIKLELLYLDEIRDWTWDPRLHDSFPYYDPREIVAGRLADIIHGDFAPEADRRASVRGQLEALPRFLAQMKQALAVPSKTYLDVAVKDNKGRIEFFQTEVKEFTRGDAPTEKARVAAVAALEDYQKFLEGSGPRATRDWRLGAALYRKKFPLALQTTLTPEEVAPRAEADFMHARQELYAVAAKLAHELWPKEPVPKGPASPEQAAKLIERVHEEIAKDHPKAPELVAAHAKNLDRLRDFIQQHDLLELPPKETLRVEPMPEFKRGGGGAEYLAPGVLDKRGPFKATYYVEPVDATWPPEKVESYLRANNYVEVELTAAHEAYPGHHTQMYYERRALDPLRAVLWNGAMAEGWACYGEGLMTTLGYGGAKNDRFRFNDLKGRLTVAANILLDMRLQGGAMTDEEALRFLTKEAFQEPAQAEKKLLRAKLDSTQLAQYYLGWKEITDLEADYRKQVGAKYSQRVFDEAIIGHGSVAVKHLRRYLLGK